MAMMRAASSFALLLLAVSGAVGTETETAPISVVMAGAEWLAGDGRLWEEGFDGTGLRLDRHSLGWHLNVGLRAALGEARPGDCVVTLLPGVGVDRRGLRCANESLALLPLCRSRGLQSRGEGWVMAGTARAWRAVNGFSNRWLVGDGGLQDLAMRAEAAGVRWLANPSPLDCHGAAVEEPPIDPLDIVYKMRHLSRMKRGLVRWRQDGLRDAPLV